MTNNLTDIHHVRTNHSLNRLKDKNTAMSRNFTRCVALAGKHTNWIQSVSPISTKSIDTRAIGTRQQVTHSDGVTT